MSEQVKLESTSTLKIMITVVLCVPGQTHIQNEASFPVQTIANVTLDEARKHLDAMRKANPGYDLWKEW